MLFVYHILEIYRNRDKKFVEEGEVSWRKKKDCGLWVRVRRKETVFSFFLFEHFLVLIDFFSIF